MGVNLAPILLFVYNRPSHAVRLVESLMNCELSKESELFIFVDAPKSYATNEDIAKNTAVIEFVNSISHFKKLTIFKYEFNKGVDKSIMYGVSKIINLYGKVIVLEDDLIVGSFFLKYMNWALDTYSNDKRIYTVNGFMFPLEYKGGNDVILLPYSSPWGWATWKDRWDLFKYDEENRTIISDSKELKKIFNIPGYDYSQMLISNKECWDINWYFHVFKNHGLNTYPSISLVKNDGFDGTGVHCTNIGFKQKFNLNIIIKLLKVENIDLNFYAAYLNYFDKIKDRNSSRMRSILKKTLTFFIPNDVK